MKTTNSKAMKTTVLILVFAMMGSTLVYSQTADQTAKLECKKKVLKKIKRQMNYVQFKDYVAEGSKTHVILHCAINENNTIQVTGIDGVYEDLNDAIVQRLEDRPIKLEEQLSSDTEFSFMLTFRHIPLNI
jgi:hypothetical protein